MRVLLDTAVAIWLDGNPARISPPAHRLIEDEATTCLLSVISIWEMEVKVLLGKLPLGVTVHEAVDRLIEGYGVVLANLEREAFHLQSRLPFHHRDPFDRLLMCQSIAEGVPILTPDRIFARYPVKTIW